MVKSAEQVIEESLTRILEIHCDDGGLQGFANHRYEVFDRCCVTCEENWPCSTWTLASNALNGYE